MIDISKYEGHRFMLIANRNLVEDGPLLLEFNQCNQAFGKDVRQLMYEYGLITFNEETMRYEVMKND